MTPYDAAMAGLVVAGMVWGGLKGITWQVASIASLVLGYAAAHTLSGQLAGSFPGEPAVARSLAMVVIYAAVSGGIFAVAWTIRATLKKLKFEAYDRHLGMVLGGLEGALLALVATLFVVGLAPQARDPIFRSPSGRVVAHVMDAVGPVLPGEVRDAIAPYWGHQAVGGPAALTAAEGRPVEKVSLRDGGKGDRSDRARPATDAAPVARPVADEPALPDAPDDSLKGRLGQVAGRVLEREIGGDAAKGDPNDPDLRSTLGQAAGRLLEQGIQEGKAPDLDNLIRQGKARLGRAASEAIRREVERLGDVDGGPSPD